MKRLGLGLACLLTACAARQAPLESASALPVSRVVLYQNGVGYFERTGTLEGNVLELQVKPSQINDLLKSLTVVDAGSGRVVSASLPLEQNADRLLEELPAQVRNAGGLLEVLRLFRGARVELEGRGGAHLEGRVIGVENLEQGSGAGEVDWRVSLKTADDEVRVYPVRAIRRLLLRDRTLSVGLDRSLDVSLGEGGWKPIELSIRLAGQSPHQVRVSYVVEMPRWKPAYRLVLEPGEASLFQGWAVVDNVSGEHWQGVGLSLMSGTPISFRYNLHAPQYTSRVDLTPVGLPRAVAPPPAELAGYAGELEAVEDEELAFDHDPSTNLRAEPRNKASVRSAPTHAEAPPTMALRPAPRVDLAAIERQGGQAEISRVGALSRYDVRDPVTVPNRSSTLVNIVNQRIAGEEVVYFRPELSPGRDTHPYRAVKFDNATGSALEKGPITVYSGGSFVGEGFVERMENGQTAFITFAIDAEVVLDQKGGTREEGFRLLRIVDGRLVSEAKRVLSTTYSVKNRRAEAVRAFIRSERRPGWSLQARPGGAVETPDALILPLDVPASKSATLEVNWERRVQRNVAIDSSNADEILRVYLQGGKAPAPLKKLIEEVMQIKRERTELGSELTVVERQHATLSRDVVRVRNNLKVLRKTQGNAALQRELAGKLGNLERDLGKLSGRRVSLSESIAELDKRLRERLRGVTLDAE